MLIITVVELLPYTDSVARPFPLVQSVSPFDTALRPTHAVEHSTPQISGPWLTDTHFWPHDGPAMAPHQPPSSVDLGTLGLRQFESSTIPSQFVHQGLLSYSFNDDLSVSKWFIKEATTHVCTCIAAAQRMPQNFQTSVPSPAGCPSLQMFPSASAHAAPAYESHLPLPPTPASPTYVSTPGSSRGSTSTTPRTSCIAIPPPRKKRLQRSVPYARPDAPSSIPGSSVEPTDAVALENARKGVLQFVTDHPRIIEPSIGELAALAIVGSNPRLGTPGKSVYSVFFSSSRGRNPRFTCLDCGKKDKRVSRAVRHQRQEHFGHYPFPCQGDASHPAW